MDTRKSWLGVLVSASLLTGAPVAAQDKIISRELEMIAVPKATANPKAVILKQTEEQTGEPAKTAPAAQPAASSISKGQKLGSLPASSVTTPTLWSSKDNEDYALMVALLKILPMHTASPTAHELKGLLLASLSNFPQKQQELYPLQVRLQTSMGEEDMLAQSSASEIIDKAKIERQLLQSDYKAACAKSAEAPSDYNDLFWKKLTLFCLVHNKEYAKAKFGLALLIEDAHTAPSYLEPLIEKIAGDKDTALSASLTNPQEPIHFALLTKAKVSFKDSLHTLSPLMQRAAALSPSQNMEVRLLAGEAAFRSGSISADDLAALYQKMPLEKNDLAAFSPDSSRYDGVKKRVIFYQFTLKQAEQDKAIASAIEFFDRQGLRDIANAVFLPSIVRYTEKSTPSSISDELLLALLAAGKTKPVEAWLNQGAGSKERKARIGALTAIASGKQMLSLQDYTHKDSIFNERLFLLLEALDYDVPATAWKQVALPFTYSTIGVSQSTSRAMEDAGKEKRKGALILAMLLALGENRPAQIEHTKLASMVTLLAENGFKKQARSLALESLLYYKK